MGEKKGSDDLEKLSVKKINLLKSAPPPPPLFFFNFFDRDREEEEQRKDACRRPARSSCCSIFSGEETDGAFCVCVNVCGIVRIRLTGDFKNPLFFPLKKKDIL